jgi:hypothetical protein
MRVSGGGERGVLRGYSRYVEMLFFRSWKIFLTLRFLTKIIKFTGIVNLIEKIWRSTKNNEAVKQFGSFIMCLPVEPKGRSELQGRNI